MKKLYVGNLSFKATEEQVAGAVFGNRSAAGFAHAACAIVSRGNLVDSVLPKIGNDAEAEKAIAGSERQGFSWPRAGGE